MSEWWTYRLGSFLLFSPRTYYRLFELYNAALWPAQLPALALGLGLAVLLARGGPARTRWIGAVLAACWLWSGVAFLAWRYAKINWAADYFAWAFAAEAVLLLWAAVLGRQLTFEPPSDLAGRAGLAIVLGSVTVFPLLAPVLGRGWRSAEIFGLAPDPTAVATLGAVLLARGRRWPLMAIPALWSLVTGVTLLAMKAPDFWVAPLAAAVTVVLAARRRR
jgi:Family of unknown function (DUF6064)